MAFRPGDETHAYVVTQPGFIYRDYAPIRPPKKKQVASGVFKALLGWRGPKGGTVGAPMSTDLTLEVRLDENQP